MPMSNRSHHPHPSPQRTTRRRLARSLARALDIAGILAIVLLAHAALASASTYDVSVCGTGSSPGSDDGLSVVNNPGSGYMDTQDLCGPYGMLMHDAHLPPGYTFYSPWNGDGAATLSAPGGTTIESLTMRAAISGFQSYLTWDVTAPGGRLLNRWAAYYGSPTAWTGTLRYTVNGSSVSSRFYCAMSCSGTGTSIVLSAITPRLSDTSAPTLTGAPGGSLLAGGPLRGRKGVSFSAIDVGGGIYKVGLLVDGRDEQLQVPDSNGGRCARPFQYLVPCRLSVSGSVTIDTTRIPDGDHEVQVLVSDATEEGRAISAPTTVTIHNAPTSIERPQLSGTPRLGTALAGSTGTWQGAPTSYSYQWLRCPSSVTSPAQVDGCSPIAGANRPDYTPGADDAYKRNAVRVTATNASGTGSAYSAPSDLIADSEGRTSPPGPSDGGSRDVVIVPIVPGGSSSSTTIINPATTGGTPAIAGLVNPLAGIPGHVPNGSGASDNAQIHVAFEVRRRGARKQVMAVHSSRNRRWVIKGRLLNAQGKPIGGGQLVTAWQLPGRRWAAHTGVQTREDGRFTQILSRGPSRAIKFVYFAYSDAAGYRESNVLTEKVTTPVTLQVAPRAARNGGAAVKFRGTVATDYLPKGGVLVRLQGHAPGRGWKDIKTVHCRADGHFTLTYGFTETTARTTYTFRAVVDRQAGYPFEGGTSRLVEVQVSP